MNKNRFWNEFKVVVADNKKLDAGVLGIVFFVPLAIMTVVMSDLFNDAGVPLIARADFAAMFCSVLSLFVMSYAASMVFGNLNNKSVQIRLMMNPSTMAEKYWARILHVSVLLILLAGMAFYASVFVWMVFHLDVVNKTVFLHLLGFNINNFAMEAVHSSIFWVLSLFSSMGHISVYAVGATYFRKHPFLYTTLVAAGVLVILMFAIGFGFGFAVAIYGEEVAKQYVPPFETVMTGLTVINFVFCILMLWWAYRRFTKLQFKSK